MVFPTIGAICPDKAGFLMKRGKMNTAFKERFFALKLDPGGEHCLYYCKGAAQYNRPVGAIPLRRCAIKVKGLEDSLYQFSILSSGRVYHLAAPTDRVLQAWTTHLLTSTELHSEAETCRRIKDNIAGRVQKKNSNDLLLKKLLFTPI
ncbi:hypothetical protein RCL1_003267 [Eukaryota sp. TZLM3-RCL]